MKMQTRVSYPVYSERSNVLYSIVLAFLGSFLYFANPALAVSGKPQNIISTTVASDEILLTLLTTDEERKRIRAVSTFADNPEFSNLRKSDLTIIPHRVGANIEHIVSLKPDLVIAVSYNHPAFLSSLKKLKIPTHIMEGFESVDDLKRHILKIGTLIGEEKKAEQTVQIFLSKLDFWRNKLKDRTTILAVMPDHTLVGKNTLLNDLLTHVGIQNLANQLGVNSWQKVNEESLVKINPGFLLTSAEENDTDHVKKTLSQSPAFRNMKAFKEGKILLVPPSVFSSFSTHIIDICPLIDRNLANLTSTF